jgi:RNA polymerase sigma-70 factor (ECF subfamily)
MTDIEFAHQITRLRGDLRTFTYRFTRDREESHDLVQDTILKALMYTDKFRENTNLKGWLFTIMRNTFINNYRKRQRHLTINQDSKDFFFDSIEDDHTFNSPGTAYEYKDIWRHIDALREELLVPFKMHTTGYKYQEISEHLNIPIGTVKNRIFNARKEIQAKLAGY